jgi:peptide/nickel transport system permease protein
MQTEAPDPAMVPLPVVATATPGLTLSPRASRRQRFQAILVALLHSKTFMIGAIVMLFWIFDAIFWPLIVPHDPFGQDLLSTLQPPSRSHPFGTDDLGRDVFSRVLAGARSVLTVAPAATALGLLGGIAIGLITGYYRGLVDDILMRIVDALLASPLVIIALLVLAVLGHSTLNVVLVIAIVFTPLIARTVRAAVLSEREREYVASAQLLGEPGIVVMVREILPNLVGAIVVEATVRLGYAIFTAATLSFLGLGIQQPSPDWGLSISLGRGFLQVASWMVLFPALALATLVVALNFVADGLREVLSS